MKTSIFTRMPALVIVLLSAFLFTACAPHQAYRTDVTLCSDAEPEKICPTSALQETIDSANPEIRYLTAFVEFDDQGQLWSRAQMDAVMTKLNQEAIENDLLLITFVHGWKHNASPEDDNVKMFNGVLQRLATLENRISRAVGERPRKVVGVYLGWRGSSVTWPLVKELTFWDRKNVAHKVGHGGVTEVLARLELIKKTKDVIVAQDEPDPAKRENLQSRTRLVVIGHSFGGAVVFSALSQLLETRFIDTEGPMGQITNARGFGDLVVLINPAFEAARYAALSDMATERGTYFAPQLPVMAVLTSEADYATKYAFPIGRWISTLFEKEHDVTRKNGLNQSIEIIDQGKANITTVGHFHPYQTHLLSATHTVDRAELAPATLEVEIKTLFNTIDEWNNDAPGNVIEFNGSSLQRSETSAGRNPYLVVKVDKQLIHDHNDIDDPRVIGFIRQLVLMTSHRQELATKQMTPQQLLNVQ